MPRILHQQGNTNANHSVYQTQAAADANGILDTIKDHHITAHGHLTTANTHHETNATKLTNIQTINDTKLSAIQTFLDKDSGSNFALALTNTKLDTIATNTSNINVNVGDVEVNTADLETLQGTTNTKLTEIDAVLDTLKTDTAAIKTAVELLDNAISGSEMQVDIVSSALPTGGATETTLSAAEVHLGNIETAVQLLDNAISGSEMQVDVVSSALPSGAATESTLSAAEVHLGNIETAVQLLDNAISGSEMQVDVVSSALPSGAATESTLSAAEVHLGNIETSLAQLDDAISGSEMQVDVVSSALPTGAATQTTLASILAKNTENEALLTSIKTAVELLDNTVSGSELQVDVVSAPTTTVTGTVTANLSSTDNAVLDDIAQKLGDVETAVQLLDNAVSGNELQVDVVASLPAGDNNIGNVDIVSSALPTGAATQTTLAAAEVHLGNIETSVQLIDDVVKAEDTAHSSGDKGVMLLGVRQDSQADFGADGDYVPFSIDGDGKLRVAAAAASGGATEAKQDVIETTLTAIETSVQALDNAVDGNYLNVNLNVAGTDVDGNSGNKSAASQRVVIATDDVNMSAIKTATEASATDLAALEVLVTATNSKIDTLDAVQDNALTKLGEIDAVLDNIKVDTEAIETAVEALNTRDVLQTTLVVDAQSVSSGGGTHTTASFELTKRPSGNGVLCFLVRIATVNPNDISVAFLGSGDDTNFFGIPLSQLTRENTATGVGQIVTLKFFPKHLKIEITNSSFSSAATVSIHMFN